MTERILEQEPLQEENLQGKRVLISISKRSDDGEEFWLAEITPIPRPEAGFAAFAKARTREQAVDLTKQRYLSSKSDS